jgi:hypothetical protein
MAKGNRQPRGAFSLKGMVERQTERVLQRGLRYGTFDQIRQRHFWSSFLFPGFAGSAIPGGTYEIFKTIPGGIGQGYSVPLTVRETNWLGAGRVPDNQNFAITELGASIRRPPANPQGAPVHVPGAAFTTAPPNGIAASMTPGQVAAINGLAPVLPVDAQSILYGTVLEFSFLTNNVPLGLLADFSESGGAYGFTTSQYLTADASAARAAPSEALPPGDPTNGIPAAAFRRKLEVPIMLQHGESMGMRLNVPRAIPIQSLANGSCGWFEVRVDWWATESFAEKS